MVRLLEQSVRDLVRNLVLELAPNPREEDLEHARLVDDLEFHSLSLLELAFTLEDEYDLQPIDEARARSIQTVGAVINHVVDELHERGDINTRAAVGAAD